MTNEEGEESETPIQTPGLWQWNYVAGKGRAGWAYTTV